MIDQSVELPKGYEVVSKPGNVGEVMSGFFKSEEFKKAREAFSFIEPNNPTMKRHKAPIGENWEQMSEDDKFEFESELEDVFFQGREPLVAFNDFVKVEDFSSVKLSETETQLMERIKSARDTSSDALGGDKLELHRSVDNVLSQYVSSQLMQDETSFKRSFGGNRDLAKMVFLQLAVSKGLLGVDDVKVIMDDMVQLKPAEKDTF